VVASLSVPWGQSHDDPGGYHLVWTRDAVEAAFALIAVGQIEDASRTLAYLIGTQAPDGSWAQNYFPDGRGYWSGRQLDEVALPVLLMAKLRAVGRLEISPPIKAMVEQAIGFIVREGPMTDQDRWEENAGASPFTLTVSICALVAAADLFEPAARDYLLSLADCWNERIESWTYAQGGHLCEKYDVAGYYVRLAPRARDGGLDGDVEVRNVADGETAARELVGLEFLYYVRAGLRPFDDPRIVRTLRVVDELLRVETPSGPADHRYPGDGDGERGDGGPFDGSGVGRAWPLLTGERGHYAVAAGEDATPYLAAMARMTGLAGLIPEQIWDSEAIPKLGLFPGKPSGSAMPLVWAHAEFLKLLAAQTNHRPTELLDAVQSRYGGRIPEAQTWHWRSGSPFTRMPAGRDLLVEAPAGFALDLARDGGEATRRSSTPGPLGMHQVRFTADDLSGAARIALTLTPAAGEAQSVAIELGG
jgi:glucoamylase